MEALLRYAGTLPGSVDAAYAALRDLGFEVEVSVWVWACSCLGGR